MTKNKPLNYLLRDVPRDVMQALKHMAVDHDQPLREEIIAALTAWTKTKEKTSFGFSTKVPH
jgi:hypothetical protein